MFESLKDLLVDIEEEYGGDISFIPAVSEGLLSQMEIEINYNLPEILRYFYTSETNGIKIDNKLIYSILDSNQKRTLSENLQRANNPKTSYWFKNNPKIFNDYLVIGGDGQICFSIYKHSDIKNPSIYMCENPNTKGQAVLEKLDIGLEGLISTMVENTF